MEFVDGNITGRCVGAVVNAKRKAKLGKLICAVEGISLEQAVAVGDGANDIPMLSTAGLGIAICAKPKVQEVADYRINHKDLSTVMFLMGISHEYAFDIAHSIKSK